MPKGVWVRLPPSLLKMPCSQSCRTTITYVVVSVISGDLFDCTLLIHVNTKYEGSIPLLRHNKCVIFKKVKDEESMKFEKMVYFKADWSASL